MSKRTITRLFIGSATALFTGVIVVVAAVVIAVVNDVFVLRDNQVVDVNGSAIAWSMLGLGIAGGVVMIGGMVGGLIAWIGALLNTAELESKTWFLILLLLGIFSFGFFAMIAYVIAGPDGTAGGAVSSVPGTT
jgi:hypothetical protein